MTHSFRTGVSILFCLILVACGVPDSGAQMPTASLPAATVAPSESASYPLPETPSNARNAVATEAPTEVVPSPTPEELQSTLQTQSLQMGDYLTMAAASEDEQLLRDVLPAAAPQSTPLHLVYGLVDEQSTANFWQLDPTTPTSPSLIFSIPDYWYEKVYGRVSPDGQTIAYVVRIGENTGKLHLIDMDGTNDRLITDKVGTTGMNRDCRSDISWKPDGSQLAFLRGVDMTSTLPLEVGVHTLSTQQTESIFRARWAVLSDWKNNDELLVFVSPDPETQIQLLSLSTTTHQTHTIAVNLSPSTIGCNKLSPDKGMLFTDYYLVDLQNETKQPHHLDLFNTFWIVNDATILEGALSSSPDQTWIYQLSTGQQVLIHLAPEEIDGAMDLVSVSPDGNYIIGCGYTRDDSSVMSMLYDVQQNTWQMLAVDTSVCIQVLGWY